MTNRRETFDDRPYVHFVTFSCDKRRKLLSQDRARRIFLGHLGNQLTSFSAKCVGFVVMPDHVHLLVWLSLEYRLAEFIQSLKRLSSHSLIEWYQKQDSSYLESFSFEGRFWTPKYHSFNIESEAKLTEKLDYIHLNPVRAGLVERAVEWKWSSARWYEQKRPVGVPVTWID